MPIKRLGLIKEFRRGERDLYVAFMDAAQAYYKTDRTAM